ncbi:hypothetical protein NDU88_003396 [Pleurodeles waltl]|uniref:Uncharacterized protein n=1 Tax=Pleurodeles waltl TaxID=8319 RepID=A0AAV7SF39_PLEWA|nr:hypothetical protein NDU88_003396 [Pleurodeles waltl]
MLWDGFPTSSAREDTSSWLQLLAISIPPSANQLCDWIVCRHISRKQARFRNRMVINGERQNPNALMGTNYDIAGEPTAGKKVKKKYLRSLRHVEEHWGQPLTAIREEYFIQAPENGWSPKEKKGSTA